MTTPLDAAEEFLTDPSLAGVVDLVLRRAGPGYRAGAARGAVDFRRLDGGFETVSTTGEPPLRHATDERVDQATEQADPWALLGAHATPYARANSPQLLDAPHGPDLAVLHAPRHRFHANAGEHGSLGLSQARAPFVAAGRGVQRLGEIDDHLRMIEVAPTLAALLGCPP
ncbi:MAG: hypothetical protein ACE5GB_12830, partial [Acidimicrobiales bacterium]